MMGIMVRFLHCMANTACASSVSMICLQFAAAASLPSFGGSSGAAAVSTCTGHDARRRPVDVVLGPGRTMLWRAW